MQDTFSKVLNGTERLIILSVTYIRRSNTRILMIWGTAKSILKNEEIVWTSAGKISIEKMIIVRERM